jgi:hypothetical protein
LGAVGCSHRALFAEFVDARGSWASILLLLLRQYASGVLLGLDTLWQDRLVCTGEVWSILVLLAVSLALLVVMRPYRDAVRSNRCVSALVPEGARGCDCHCPPPVQTSMYCEMATLALETIFAALLAAETQSAGTVPVQALYAVAGAIMFLNIGIELQLLLQSRLVALAVRLRLCAGAAAVGTSERLLVQAFMRGFSRAADAPQAAVAVESNQVQSSADSDEEDDGEVGGRSSPPLPSLEPIPDGETWATPRRAVSPSEDSSAGYDHDEAGEEAAADGALPPSPTRAALPVLPSRDVPTLSSKRRDKDRPTDSQRSSPSEGSGSAGSIGASAPSVRLDDPGMARTRLPKRKGKGKRDGGKFEPLFIQDPD